MKRKELLDKLRATSEVKYDTREASAVAMLIAEHLTGLRRVDFISDPAADVTFNAVALADACRRIVSGEPVQYIIGNAQFCGFTFKVAPGVLIPRPETEELVLWITDDAMPVKAGLRILDIGTGSGAIAVSLAGLLPGSMVDGVDISTEALAIAAENARINGVLVNFSQADVLLPFAGFQRQFPYAGQYDIIVSNPPYIPNAGKATMSDNVVNFEPGMALFVSDDDPLIFYRAIGQKAASLLAPGGRLYFEIHEDFPHEVCSLLEELGFSDVECRNDINDKPRMVRCRKR